MERAEIEREVHRLAPWYYLFDLNGVRTDVAPPIHDHVFRTVHFPRVAEGFWNGKTVLDVACNEGAYSFGALEAGVARVDAFDVRASNIEKARFVQSVLGCDGVEFRVASIEEWLAERDDEYDFVMLNGILYHLVEPWNVIRDFCKRAKEGILTTCVLHGGEDGYTRYSELDNAGASADSVDSMMPNTTNTLVQEFAKHGFHPAHVQESRVDVFWGSCSLFLYRGREDVDVEAPTGATPPLVDLHLVTPGKAVDGRSRPLDLFVCGYNLAEKPRAVNARVRAADAEGRVLFEQGPDRVALEARVADGGAMSQSFDSRIALDLEGATGDVTVEVSLRDPQTDELLRARRLVVRG